MLVVIMTLLDLAVFVNLSLFHFGASYSNYFLLIGGLYFIGKGVVFRDFMSIVDALCGIYVVLVFWFGWTTIVYYLIFGWMFFKIIPVIMEFM